MGFLFTRLLKIFNNRLDALERCSAVCYWIKHDMVGLFLLCLWLLKPCPAATLYRRIQTPQIITTEGFSLSLTFGPKSSEILTQRMIRVHLVAVCSCCFYRPHFALSVVTRWKGWDSLYSCVDIFILSFFFLFFCYLKPDLDAPPQTE